MNHLDKKELLSKLGLETKPSIGNMLVSALGPFGAGMLVGAGVALLLAPKSGRELRENIRDKVNHDGLAGMRKPKLGNGEAVSDGSTA
jgi:uncharacterized membrane protein YebE (DUF533 family)